VSAGWGLGPWGFLPWGSGLSGTATNLQLLGALAIRDNVVRLQFNVAPLASGLFEAGDALEIDAYQITPVPRTFGLDGLPTRSVFPVVVTLADVAMSFGTFLDVTGDRPFSPYPGQYIIALQGITTYTGLLLDPTHSSFVFYGLSRGQPIQSTDKVVSSKDIANIQNIKSVIGMTPNEVSSPLLGTIPVDSKGDLANDSGLISYRKRIMRRCMTRKGGFAHLPDYGVGLSSQIKQLSRPGIRESIAADAESQIKQEPETLSVKCMFVHNDTTPELYWLKIQVITIFSDDPLIVSVPFTPTG
jgi:hypothetical protein